jgi:hypothetical protein
MRLQILFLSVPILLISACGPSAEELAPTILTITQSANQTATAAVGQALADVITMTAAAITPSATVTPTPTTSLTPVLPQ